MYCDKHECELVELTVDELAEYVYPPQYNEYCPIGTVRFVMDDGCIEVISLCDWFDWSFQ